MAMDELRLTLYDMEEDSVDIPEPTAVEKVKHKSGEIVTLIACDTL